MHSQNSHRRLDVAGLTLFLIGFLSGFYALWAIANYGLIPLILIPSVIAATTGAMHLTKWEAKRS